MRANRTTLLDFIYITSLFILSYVYWYLEMSEILLVILVFLASLNVLILKRPHVNLMITFLIISGLNGFLINFNTDDGIVLSEFLYLVILAGVTVSLVLFDMFRLRKGFVFNNSVLAGILFLVTMIPSFFFTDNFQKSLIWSLIYLVGFLLYLIFRLYKEITLEHFSLVVVFFTFLVIIQMFTVFYEGDMIYMISNEIIRVDLITSNRIGQFIAYAIPFTVYLAIRSSRFSFIYYCLVIVEVLSLFMTGGRSGMLSFAIILIPLLILVFMSHSKTMLFVNFIIFIVAMYFIYSYANELGIIDTIVERIEKMGLADNGRYQLWKQFPENFLTHPFVGSGIFTNKPIIGMDSYHNVIFDVVATTGIIGFGGFLYFFIIIFKNVIIKISIEKVIVGLGVIVYFVTALLDTTFYNPVATIFIFISIMFIEDKQKYKVSLWKN